MAVLSVPLRNTEKERLLRILEDDSKEPLCSELDKLEPAAIDSNDIDLIYDLITHEQLYVREWAFRHLACTARLAVELLFEHELVSIWISLKENVRPDELILLIRRYLTVNPYDGEFALSSMIEDYIAEAETVPDPSTIHRY